MARNYYFFVIVTVIFTVIQNLLIMVASKRMFPNIFPLGELPEEKRRAVISDVKSIFLHRFGAVISRPIDNVVISAFMGLDAVAAYGNYYYVYTTVAGIPAIIYSTMMGGFGNRIHTESREENFKLFMHVERTVGIIIIFCAAMMLALYQPFIKVWMGQKHGTLALHFLMPVLMVLYFYVNQSRQVLLTFKAAAGLWREDRWKPVVGGAVKLLICLLFIRIMPDTFKLDGVILSSLIGYIFVQIPWESHVVFTRFFDREQARAYWRHQLVFALLGLIPCAAALGAVRAIPLDGVRGLIVQGISAFAVTAVIMLILFRGDLKEMLQKALRRS